MKSTVISKKVGQCFQLTVCPISNGKLQRNTVIHRYCRVIQSPSGDILLRYCFDDGKTVDCKTKWPVTTGKHPHLRDTACSDRGVRISIGELHIAEIKAVKSTNLPTDIQNRLLG